MLDPTILDKHNHPLSVGDRVKRERVFSDGPATEFFRRVRWLPRRGWMAYTDAAFGLLTQPADQPNTYRCPELERIQDQPESKGESKDG